MNIYQAKTMNELLLRIANALERLENSTDRVIVALSSM